jgi:hypothetical protein
MEDNPLDNLLDLMADVLGFNREQFERFVCWAQYLYLAELQRQHYMAWRPPAPESEEGHAGWDLIWLQASFYAGLWAVVEGWPKVPLSDPVVDELLNANPQYLDLLKRYRNSVFHFQPNFAEMMSRRRGLLREGTVASDWLIALHMEFCRVYWKALPPLGPASPDSPHKYREMEVKLCGEIRGCMRSLVGWIPDNVPEAHAARLKGVAELAMARIREAGNFESDEARRLLNIVAEVPHWIQEGEFKHEQLTRGVIDRVRATAPDGDRRGDHTDQTNQGEQPGRGKPQ